MGSEDQFVETLNLMLDAQFVFEIRLLNEEMDERMRIWTSTPLSTDSHSNLFPLSPTSP